MQRKQLFKTYGLKSSDSVLKFAAELKNLSMSLDLNPECQKIWKSVKGERKVN